MPDRGPRGDRGPQGPLGAQGAAGEGPRGWRGLQGHPGERGPAGKPGNRVKLPRRVFVAFVALGFANAGAFWVALEDRDRIQEGRRTAALAFCAFGSGIAEAGRTVIEAGAREPRTEREKRFERNLERLGRPSLEQRQAAAQLAGRAYVASIAARVEEQTGVKGLVIREGPGAGSLNCKKLGVAAELGR